MLLELERRSAEVGYAKTDAGLEIDFLARHPGAGEELIQVCADPTNDQTRERELGALTEPAKEHRRAVRRLLVLDRDAAAGVSAPGVAVEPAYEWLLRTPDGS